MNRHGRRRGWCSPPHSAWHLQRVRASAGLILFILPSLPSLVLGRSNGAGGVPALPYRTALSVSAEGRAHCIWEERHACAWASRCAPFVCPFVSACWCRNRRFTSSVVTGSASVRGESEPGAASAPRLRLRTEGGFASWSGMVSHGVTGMGARRVSGSATYVVRGVHCIRLLPELPRRDRIVDHDLLAWCAENGGSEEYVVCYGVHGTRPMSTCGCGARRRSRRGSKCMGCGRLGATEAVGPASSRVLSCAIPALSVGPALRLL
ncbi:hypothetical protein K438DRAFT_1167858 [Mycena galopus ATCC 62051]|nr:hypothetical protein K438DRAFT_1167858 [Mycena galopus ATCC 62051]